MSTLKQTKLEKDLARIIIYSNTLWI